MLELMCESVGHIVVVAGRRAVRTRRSWVAILLRIRIRIRCVVEVSLVADSTRLLSPPDFLLTCGIGKWLWKGRGSGRELSTLLGGEIGSVVVAKVQL